MQHISYLNLEQEIIYVLMEPIWSHRRITQSKDQDIYEYADGLFEENKEFYRMR